MLSYEEQRLNAVEAYIICVALARSQDVPDQTEDMAQAAREAVIKRLQQNPDSPNDHLCVVAKSAILDYRRQGCSVDGKLDQTRRQRQYTVFSGSGLEVALKTLSPTALFRVTEEKALLNTVIDQIRDQLSPEENLALTWRLNNDTSWAEISRRLGIRNHNQRLEKRIRAITEQILNN